MIEFMRSWVGNIAIVMIFIIILDIIMPSGDMKRFVKVIAGLVIILAIIKPFVLIKSIGASFQLNLLETQAYIDNNMDINGEKINSYQKQQAADIYKDNIKKQLAKEISRKHGIGIEALEISLDIEGDLSNDEYGKIKELYVIVHRNDTSSIQVSKIEQVEINDNKAVMNGKASEYNLNDSKLCSEIKNEIQGFLGVEEEDVTVEILQ